MSRDFKGVMVSSTFTDLKEHRAALIKLINSAGFKAVVMENDSAKSDVDVIDSSLQMVGDAAVYIGIIAKKLGQILKCSTRNPGNVSITELEFNKAVRLGLPILLEAYNKEIGLLLNFGTKSLQFKRVHNNKRLEP